MALSGSGNGAAGEPSPAEATVLDLCLKLGIGEPRIKALRKTYPDEAALVAFLRQRWAEVGDHPRYPRAGGGSSHVGDDSFAWPDHEPGCTCNRCLEQIGYTRNPLRAVEPGVEAVPADYQQTLSERARRNLAAVRQVETERREFTALAQRMKDLAKRAAPETSFVSAIGVIRRELDALERVARVA